MHRRALQLRAAAQPHTHACCCPSMGLGGAVRARRVAAVLARHHTTFSPPTRAVGPPVPSLRAAATATGRLGLRHGSTHSSSGQHQLVVAASVGEPRVGLQQLAPLSTTATPAAPPQHERFLRVLQAQTSSGVSGGAGGGGLAGPMGSRDASSVAASVNRDEVDLLYQSEWMETSFPAQAAAAAHLLQQATHTPSTPVHLNGALLAGDGAGAGAAAAPLIVEEGPQAAVVAAEHLLQQQQATEAALLLEHHTQQQQQHTQAQAQRATATQQQQQQRADTATAAATAAPTTAAAKRALLAEQFRLEERTTAEAAARYRELADGMAAGGRAGALRPLARELLSWYDPLVSAIEAEQARVWEGAGLGPGAPSGPRAYGPLLVLLAPEKLAVMVMHETVNLCLACGNAGVPAAALCLRLAEAAQAEVNLLKMQSKLGRAAHAALRKSARRHVRVVNLRAKRALDMLEVTDWPEALKAQLGAVLVKLLCDAARVPERVKGAKQVEMVPAFKHEVRQISRTKKLGMLLMTPAGYARVKDLSETGASPLRYLPMLVPPKLWARHDRGAYLVLKARIMRTRGCRGQTDALRAAKLDRIFHGLNCLGRVPWRVNPFVLDTIEAAWSQGLTVGELPPLDDLPLPPLPQKPPPRARGAPRAEGAAEAGAEARAARAAHARVAQLNRDRHSLRSDLRIKLGIAREFRDRSAIYFPYNLDFRGRVYPIPPNLNHMGNDLCRGVLTFAEARPLGARGLFWLKVQAASLYGKDKLSFEERAAYADAHMDAIRGAAEDPLGERGVWWREADAPWQCLATCRELISALDSGDPEGYMSSLPIHQDGSCNGLQHYAALGRDEAGGKQVNLLPGGRPRDVYAGVCKLVVAEVERAAAAELPPDAPPSAELEREYARMLVGMVDRKVVKQTVMTSVYGVTFIGARSQIQARLEERLPPPADASDAGAAAAREAAIHGCASYLASLTLRSLSGLFAEARAIMDWLAALARIVAAQGQPMAWVTPLGLPVVQPYRRSSEFIVQTLLQSVTLHDSGEGLPVSSSRQRSAFPPNFVHSLDSTHMMLTAAAMDARGLPFAAVHDSYWCHAGNVDTMNGVLRDAFVDLYSRPILEDLHRSLELRFPGVEFPPVPPRGSLDLGAVRESPYFFN